MLENFDLCDNILTEDNTPVKNTQINYCEDDSQTWTEDNLLEHKAVQETIKVIVAIVADKPEDTRVEAVEPMLVDIQPEIFAEMVKNGSITIDCNSSDAIVKDVCSRLD